MRLKLVGLLGGIMLFLSCQETKVEAEDYTTYFCGAENRVQTEEGSLIFRSETTDFKSAENQSSDYAFEGNYAVKLDGDRPYGMSFLLTGIEEGEFFSASAWQKEGKNNGALICAVTGQTNFVLNSLGNGFYNFKDGWVQHHVEFMAVAPLDSVTFFLFAGGEGETVYFDNFEVKRYKNKPTDLIEGAPHLDIWLPDSSQATLSKYVRKAVKEEIIRDKYKEYVFASMPNEKDTALVEMRLKGDWTDHLVTGNVSYRIKTGSDYAYEGLRSFSIQHPQTRNYMHEWFLHRLCDFEGLLSTRYEFLQAIINDVPSGVYALEEHFDKQLLESRNRREGPILKLDESGFWALAIMEREQELGKIPYPFYESSVVSCFKKGRTQKSAALSAQFQNGIVLLEHFKNNYDRPDLLFDMNQVATYYALMDLGNVHHSLAWHNRRFYYNPVTAKLEHIGFDMIPMIPPHNPLLATAEFKKKPEKLLPEDRLNHYLFLNEDFRKVYTEKLKTYSSIHYLDSVFAVLEEEIHENEQLVAVEMPYYFFKKEGYYEKAELIRDELTTLDERWDIYMAENMGKKPNFSDQNYDYQNRPLFVKEISINAFLSEIDSTHFRIQMENYHFDSVSVIGYAVKSNKDSIIPFDEKIPLGGFKSGQDPDKAELILNQKPSRLFLKPKNLPGEVKKVKFNKWKKPDHEHPRIKLHQGFKRSMPYYTIKNNELVFKQGEYQIDQLIYIPEKINVTINHGTTIDFINGGGLIINDNTQILGTVSEKVVLKSTDGSGMGLTILNAENVSINHLEVENMNTLDYEGWTLTGAVTVYESNVVISHLHIKGNNCEDGLNVIRSTFDISNCLIEETKSDGFDADFCSGVFRQSTFKNTGNDCIDFSGSQVTIRDITILNSGDKGVSAGERSTLILSDITIDGALTGLASKDDSYISAANVTVKNAEVGLAAFQKKPEYDGSKIVLEKVKYLNLARISLIEEGSEVVFNGESYYGYQKFDIDRMYARFGEK